MAIDNYKEILKRLASNIDDQEESPDKKAARAREEVFRAASSQMATGQRQAQKQGLGTSGAQLLAGTRMREGVSEAAGRAATDARESAEDKQFQQLGTLAGLEAGGEQLEMQREQLDTQKDNQAWQQAHATKQLETQVNMETARLEQAERQFNQGALNQQKLLQIQQDYATKMNFLNQKFQSEQNMTNRLYQSAESEKDRQHAFDVMAYQKELNKKPWWQKALQVAGAVSQIAGAAVKGGAA